MTPDQNFPIDDQAVSIKQLFELCPSLRSVLNEFGLATNLVRVKIEKIRTEIDQRLKIQTNIVVQPDSTELIDKFLEHFEIPLSEVPNIDCEYFGRAIKLSLNQWHDQIAENIVYPNGISVSDELTYIYVPNTRFSEFSQIYMGTFMLGMLCRYYPEIWMKQIEARTEFSALSEMYCDSSMRRIPVCMARNLGNLIILYSGLAYNI